MKSFQEFVTERKDNAESFLGAKPSQRYKLKDQWMSAAKDQNLSIKTPSATPNGDNNNDTFHTASDKQGNLVGVWYKNEGVLK